MAVSGSGSTSIQVPSRRAAIAEICWPWMKLWTELATDEPAKADFVKLRYFAGLTMPEAAAALGYFPGHRRAVLVFRPRLAICRNGGPRVRAHR